MTNLEIFAEIMNNDFYFSENVTEKNHLEWDDEKTAITIFNDDSFSVHGVGSIGHAAELLNLCCTARWDIYNNRLEISIY